MTTFTLYRADVHNSSKSGSIAHFDTFFYLDGDLTNWDTRDEYKLPDDWSFVDGHGEDFSYLITDKNELVEAQNIALDKNNGKPYTYVADSKGVIKIFFEKVKEDSDDI